MKTLLIILLSLCVLILACQSKKANEINATVSLEERLKQLDSIKDSIERTDSNIHFRIDTGKNELSIHDLKWFFKDTSVSDQTFPWIDKIIRCRLSRIINNNPYESYLYVFFTKDSLRDNQIDSLCWATDNFGRREDVGFAGFYGGRNTIILHRINVDRRENHIYSDTLLFNTRSGLMKCGYRPFNRELRNYIDLLPPINP